VVDPWLNAASVNQTVNLTFGAGITVPGTGVVLNDEMDDFSATAGAPNAFGLVGGEGNAIEPGKRPLSSMAPTIVVRDGRPVLVLGGAGGPVIITAVVQVIAGVLAFRMDPAEAVSMPRFHHQCVPDVLVVEKGLPGLPGGGLGPGGAPIETAERLGVVHAAAWNGKTGRWEAVRDPRLGRAPIP
jgi:gamma-glutamyltranspeptidase/glutathione hydrolase